MTYWGQEETTDAVFESVLSRSEVEHLTAMLLETRGREGATHEEMVDLVEQFEAWRSGAKLLELALAGAVRIDLRDGRVLWRMLDGSNGDSPA